MNYHDELRRAFEALADRLREEVSRQLDSTRRELAAAETERVRLAIEEASAARATAEDEAAARFAEALHAAEERARDKGRREGHELGFREGHGQGLSAGREQAREASEKRPTADDAATRRLIDGLRALDGARSLSEILNTLAVWAAGESSRAAVLLVESTGLRAWRFHGFESLDHQPSADVAAASGGDILMQAVQSGPIFGASGQDLRAPAFAALPDGPMMGAAPIVVGGEPVAVLYADAGPDGRGQVSQVQIEALTLHAARALEAMTAFRAAHLAVDGGWPLSGRPVVQ